MIAIRRYFLKEKTLGVGIATNTIAKKKKKKLVKLGKHVKLVKLVV
jgi:hypothetical protein